MAAVTAELAEILPKLSSCRGASLLMSGSDWVHLHRQSALLPWSWPGGAALKLATTSQNKMLEGRARGAASALSQRVDEQNGVDSQAVAALLQEARRVIIAARGALF